MNPISPDSNSSSWQITTLEEKIEYTEILTDEQIDALPAHELKDRLKNSQVVIIQERNNTATAKKQFDDATRDYQKTLAESTRVQALANFRQNQVNRTDFQALERNTSLSFAGKVLSLILTVASVVVTILCIVI